MAPRTSHPSAFCVAVMARNVKRPDFAQTSARNLAPAHQAYRETDADAYVQCLRARLGIHAARVS
jgi:hypothetical protein